MVAANIEIGRVVLYQPAEDQRAVARRAERHNLAVDAAESPEQIQKVLGDPARGVLLLFEYSAETRAVARAVRSGKGWKRLPVFAVAPDETIDAQALKQANDDRIELLPTSLPEARRWEKLRDAHESVRAGKRWFVRNLRSHFRLPVKAKATLLAEAETVDISEGGVAFLTNYAYRPGDNGSMDIRSLLGDMEENERGFAFEVVSVKSVKQAGYRYCIGAQFVNLSDDARLRLKEALELIEPTVEEE